MYTFIEAERGGGAAPHEEDPGQAAAAMCKNHGFCWGFNEGREVLHSEPLIFLSLRRTQDRWFFTSASSVQTNFARTII